MANSNSTTPAHRALILSSNRAPLTLQTQPKPTPTPGSAIIRVLAVPIVPYMTDILSGKRPYPLSFPLTPGGSCIARIDSVGPDATSLTPGQLVFCNVMIRGRDDSSLSILLGIHGGFAQEAKKLMDGEWRHGTWATYAKFPLESLIPLPEPRLCKELGYQIKELTTIGMLAVLYGGLAEIGVGAGETLIVAPATGFYGAAAVGVALALGCTAVAAGRNMGQLRKLEEIFGGTQRFKTFVLMGDVGIDTESLKKSWGLGRGADAYIDFSPPAAAGSTHITSCLGALRQGGKAVLMGGILGNIELPYSMIMFRGLRIQGQFMFERRHVERLVRLVDSSALKLGREIGMLPGDGFKELADVE